MLIKNDDVLKVLGKKIKQSRLSKKYTQEYVAESIDISIDLLRNLENGRNIGSVPTLLNLCNFYHYGKCCFMQPGLYRCRCAVIVKKCVNPGRTG